MEANTRKRTKLEWGREPDVPEGLPHILRALERWAWDGADDNAPLFRFDLDYRAAAVTVREAIFQLPEAGQKRAACTLWALARAVTDGAPLALWLLED